MVEIETLLGSYAFPIVMCVWFMFRPEKIITANTEATNRMIQILEKNEKLC